MVVFIIGIFYDTNKYSLHKDQDEMYTDVVVKW